MTQDFFPSRIDNSRLRFIGVMCMQGRSHMTQGFSRKFAVYWFYSPTRSGHSRMGQGFPDVCGLLTLYTYMIIHTWLGGFPGRLRLTYVISMAVTPTWLSDFLVHWRHTSTCRVTPTWLRVFLNSLIGCDLLTSYMRWLLLYDSGVSRNFAV